MRKRCELRTICDHTCNRCRLMALKAVHKFRWKIFLCSTVTKRYAVKLNFFVANIFYLKIVVLGWNRELDGGTNILRFYLAESVGDEWKSLLTITKQRSWNKHKNTSEPSLLRLITPVSFKPNVDGLRMTQQKLQSRPL